MAIELKEVADIEAPLEDVWRFLLSPTELASCMPGAEVTEVIDDRSFKGSLRIRVGAISAKYVGAVTYQEVDLDRRRVVMKLQAGEGSGGTVNGTISTELVPVSDKVTRADVQSSIDATGRLIQVGRGMIDGIARQVIGTFVGNVQKHLAARAPVDSAGREMPAGPSDDKQKHAESLNVSAFVWKAIVSRLSSVFARLFRRSRSSDQ